MTESRLAGLRKGFENAATLSKLTAEVKARIPQGTDISTPEGRGQVLNALYAERRVDSMAETIRKATGGFVTDQELKDAAYLLSVASRGGG
jgi:hypothetical protein